MILVDLDRKGVSEAVSILGTLKVNFDNSHDGGRVLQLARAHGLTVYDAFCVELALRMQTSFPTLDRKLASVAEREGIHVR